LLNYDGDDPTISKARAAPDWDVNTFFGVQVSIIKS
jgi:hypothetical protein